MSYHAIILTGTSKTERIKPLGSYLISNVLRNNNFNTIVIDYINEMNFIDIEFLLKKFISKDTLFVGYGSSLFWMSEQSINNTINPFNTFFLKKINDLIKQVNPHTKILLGGACTKTVCNYNLKHKDNLGFDYVMHGYSEKMIVDFATSLKNKQTPKFNNTFNKLYEINYDFKGEGFDYHNSCHTWHPTDFIRQNETLPIEIGRGCIFKCKFCAYPLLGKNPNDNSYYKKENNLLNDILSNYQNYKTLNYFIVDDTFNERTDKIEMLLRVRDKSKLDLNFVAFNRIELISRKKEQISLLKDLNLTGYFFGIETLNYPTAKIIGKGIKIEEIKETVYKMRDTYHNNNISIKFALIVGLPKETPELFDKNIEWLRHPNSGVDSVSFNPLYLTFNTHSESIFFKDPTKYGYSSDDNGQWFSDAWTQSSAIKASDQYTKEFFNSDFQKISGFRAAVIAGYSGYNYFDLIKTKEKDFNFKKFDIIYKFYVKNYIDKLKKLT